MRRAHQNLLALLGIAVVLALALVLGGRASDSEEKFAGTDASATETIEKDHPDYEPWFESIFEPAGGEVESGLFALQAGLGGTVLGFALGALWQRRRSSRPASTSPAVPESH